MFLLYILVTIKKTLLSNITDGDIFLPDDKKRDATDCKHYQEMSVSINVDFGQHGQ